MVRIGKPLSSGVGSPSSWGESLKRIEDNVHEEQEKTFKDK